jgi:hypothetical protein
MKRLVRRYLLRITAIVVVLTVLANALYVGHWPFLPGYRDAATPAEAHEHAGHCPTGPSKCSDAPAPTPSTPLPMLLSDAGAASAALGVLLLVAEDLRRSALSAFAQRPKRPPRRTSAVFPS